MKPKFVLPQEVFSIKQYEAKYIVIAAFCLAAHEVTNMVSANPSTFIKLLEVMREKKVEIISILKTGDFSHVGGLTDDERNKIKPYFKKNIHRGDECENLFNSRAHITYRELLPKLRVVTTWTAGSCGIQIPRLKDLLSPDTHIIDAGYMASEFRGSINVDVEQNRAVPTLHENFFEFVERDNYESGNLVFETLATLKESEEYYVFITTSGGLYRYHMNDIVRVTGFFNQTPTITFVQKGKGVTNLTGEKLYESQVLVALEKMRCTRITSIDFFVMIGDETELGYTLYLETAGDHFADIAKNIDRVLADQNIEYDAKRKSGRLKPLKVFFVKAGTGDAYKKSQLEKGVRENQFKLQPLQYKKDFNFDIDQYIQKS
jgi:hypothetical protein